MEEIRLLIARATAARSASAEKSQAFGEIVRRFQDLAFGCAYSVLGDFHLAQDAAQEAFLAAWRNLDSLRSPEAFPGWLKRVVLTQCHRLTRGKRAELVTLDRLEAVPAATPEPGEAYEAKEHQARVLEAIRELPQHERVATMLFYVGDYSQNEIAAFLEVPVTTVKKRLFSARQRLRAGTLARTQGELLVPGQDADGGGLDRGGVADALRETLRARRPSRDPQFAETVALFTAALDSFVAKVRQDRYVIAAILYGSLAYDTVWRKSDIDVILIGRDEKARGRFCLVENNVNIHASLYPRSAFKQGLERALHGGFWHSAFALSTLLFTTDDTIRAYYDDVQRPGSRDRQMRLIGVGADALASLAKAEKWLVTRRDVAYSFLWIMYTIEHLAKIEVLLQGELTTREVLPQALERNPAFFKRVYTDLIHEPKSEATIRDALALIDGYIDERVERLFGPVLDHLRAAGGVRTTSELNEYFAKQTQSENLGVVCEWLADRGTIQKVPSPVRLTPKSQVVLDEAAYYFDGLGAEGDALADVNAVEGDALGADGDGADALTDAVTDDVAEAVAGAVASQEPARR